MDHMKTVVHNKDDNMFMFDLKDISCIRKYKSYIHNNCYYVYIMLRSGLCLEASFNNEEEQNMFLDSIPDKSVESVARFGVCDIQGNVK